MHLASELATAQHPALLPPQHETALNFYHKTMETDWHLPTVFTATTGEALPESEAPPLAVLIRVEARVTSSREEPSAKVLRNSVYHFTSNITHAQSAHV